MSTQKGGLMKRDWNTSKYDKFIRITKEKLDWLRKNRGIYSLAGFLDKIINEYKKNNEQ
jgi:hypothetical protein